MLAREEAFATVCLSVMVMDSTTLVSHQLLLLLSLLETIRKISRSIAAHVYLNLVQTLSHAS